MAKTSFARLVPCFAALLAPAALAEIPEEFLQTPFALGFGAPPSVEDPKMSPDGTRLIFLHQNPEGITLLSKLDLMTGEIGGLLQGAPSGQIQWCEWVNNERIMCDLRQGLPGRTPDYQLYYSLNADGTDLQQMRREVSCRSYDKRREEPPLEWLPSESEEVLIVCGGSAQRLNVYSRRLTDVSGAGQSGVAPFLFSDGHGLGRLYRAQEDDFTRWYERDTVSSSWVRFHEINPLRFDNPFQPVGFGRELDSVYNIGSENGKWALFSMDLESDYENQLVFSHPTQDIELVDTLGPHDRVVAVAYLDGRPRRHVVDERIAEVHAKFEELLRLQVSGEQNFEVIDESWDETKYLLRVRSPRRAGWFALLDMEAGTIQLVAPEYGQLDDYPLAETLTVQFQNADGQPIAAHLTIPEELEWPLPTVIIPRGEPSHHDLEDPHYLVQFLAAMGYAVMRVDARSFTDYGGGGWLPVRAIAGWEQTADDLNAAVRYLAAEGVTDPDRVCAAGRNYGAYSAYMTSIKYPDLFKCIVGIAGISDPRATPGARAISNALSGVGGNILDQSSPIHRASEINPPIFLFHGRADPELSYSTHAVDFVNALNRAGKDVTFIEYEYAGNEIRRGTYRVDMLARTGQFLIDHIGESFPPEDAPSEDVPPEGLIPGSVPEGVAEDGVAE